MDATLVCLVWSALRSKLWRKVVSMSLGTVLKVTLKKRKVKIVTVTHSIRNAQSYNDHECFVVPSSVFLLANARICRISTGAIIR